MKGRVSVWERLEAMKPRKPVEVAPQRPQRPRVPPDRVADIRRQVMDTLRAEARCWKCDSYLGKYGTCSNHECGVP